MFIRFRATETRLQLSVIETSRRGGKVHHRHVASLGSLPLKPLPADRVAFLKHLDARLDGLRIDATLRAKLRGEIEARVPLPTASEEANKIASETTSRSKRHRKKGRPLRERTRALRSAHRPDNDNVDEDDEETIWRRGLLYRLHDVVAQMEFEDWSGHYVDDEILTVAREAARATAKQLKYLKEVADGQRERPARRR
jgi:hypothetical protein